MQNIAIKPTLLNWKPSADAAKELSYSSDYPPGLASAGEQLASQHSHRVRIAGYAQRAEDSTRRSAAKPRSISISLMAP